MTNTAIKFELVKCEKNEENPSCVESDDELQRYISGKYLMFMTNNKRVDVTQEGPNSVQTYADIHWLPIDLKNPTTTRFSYERYVVSTFVDRLAGFFGNY